MSIRNGHARWAFDISRWRPTLEELVRATACIQPEEKERLAKFVFRDDFDSSLAGRLLMRKFIANTTNIPYEQIVLERDARGKPYLQHEQQQQDSSSTNNNTTHCLDFNVSHQGAFSVLAGCNLLLSDYSNKSSILPSIGVDIMKMEYTGGKPLNDFFRIMRKNFSNDEWTYIKSLSSPKQEEEAFMRYWCLKESYAKNIGLGVTIDFAKVSFAIKTQKLFQTKLIEDTTLTVDNVPMTRWTFEESLVDAEHCVAVALNNYPENIPKNTEPFKIIDFNELMKESVPLLDSDYEYCTEILKKEYKK